MTFHARGTRTAVELFLITVLILASFFPAQAVAQATDPDPASTPPAGAPALSVQAAGATSVTAAWTAVEGATGYALYRYDTEWTRVGGGTLTATTHTDTGLTAGQTYYYAVAAVNAAGRGPWSESVPITLSASAQTPPAGAPALSVQAAGATSVTAAWTAVEGATGYALYRYDTEWTQVGDGTLTATTYTDTGLTTGQAYYYAVAAVNAAGRGPWSESMPITLSSSAQTPPAGAPSLSVQAVAQATNPADRAALEALYNAANGAGWTNNSNWLSDRPLGEWHGVTTDSNGRVTSLELTSNQLSGTIPPTLGNLTNLTVLDLWGNQLSGSIPSELGNLTNLTFLNFWENQLSGSIPSELGNLTNLTYLLLGVNQLSGSIPSELGNLSNLTELFLHTNQLSGSIPSQLGNLTNLTHLSLDSNQLSGSIPSELGNLSNLTFLGLGSNQLSGSIPSELGSLANLVHLSLWNNDLSGSIPSELGNLTNLTDLRLSGNQLGGEIPSELGNLTDLEYLYLFSNGLSGEIPSELGNLTNLTHLELQANQLSGSIPSELGNLTNLTRLILYNNQLSGSIPSELGNLTNLTRLYLSGNQLSGCIPAVWRNVQNNDLAQLNLQFCSASTLPASAPTLSVQAAGATSVTATWTAVEGATGYALYRYDTAWTQVGGGTLTATTYTDTGLTTGQQYHYAVAAVNAAGRGPWSASVSVTPAPLADRAALVALYNATNGANWKNNSNWLSDRPLGEWRGVTTDANGRVTSLFLPGNRLSGSIPSELGNLTNLTDIWLIENQLSGSIPSQLGNLANLTYISLSGNQLSGEIPSELGNLSNLTDLWLTSNQLSGEIPSELGNLINLTALGLNGNQLSGEIPSELGNLTNLTALILSGNQLSGCIPAVLRNVQNNDLDQLGLPFCPSDRAALEALYNATNGANWTNNSNWLSDSSLGEWHGVTTDANGRVTSLLLPGNGLSGSIPSQLGNLSNLTSLYLWDNQLSGSIPSELGNLANLTDLILYNNQLSGEIPSQLGNLTNLSVLALHTNQLSGSIPSQLGNLANLTVLDLGTNQLSGSIPSELGNLTNLTGLSLRTNQLSGSIPSELGNLTNLTHLFLAGNQLSGCIPAVWGNVQDNDLAQLNLQSCSASTPPASAPTLSVQAAGATSVTATWTAVEGATGYALYRYDTEWTQVGGDTLTGTTYTDTGLTTGQEYYYAVAAVNAAGRGPWSASVSVTPAPLADRAALEALYNATDGPNWQNKTNWLSDRPLSEWHGVGTDANGRVTSLSLWGNQLSGSIPSELGNLTNLTTLRLWRNQLSGEIPSELGNLANLTQLILYRNQLSGEIPSELGNLANLTTLYLWGNQLSGSIPSELGNLTNLNFLDLGINQLSGSIPSELGNLAHLTFLSLRDTQLSGSIPSELGNLTNLTQLRLAGNQLTGCIPAVLRNVQNNDLGQLGLPFCLSPDRAALEALYNAANGAGWTNNSNWMSNRALGQWHGVTTDSNGRVTALHLIDNQLSGTIPPELGNLANLTSLDLGDNQLRDSIPSELGNLANLTYLSLFNNQLSGSIPSELGNLANLAYLYLSGNRLIGSIPSELGNLPNLTHLYLTNNQLSGSIPSELGNLANLAYLYLSGNRLSGSIPSTLDNLPNLTHLYLTNNQLSGSIPSELGNLSNLTYLYLSGNQLSGSIPSTLGTLTNLRHLYLTNNQLSGSIPSELGNLSNLIALSLSFNQFSGCVSPSLRNVADNDLDQLGLDDCRTLTLTARVATESSVGLTWTAMSGATGYELQRSRDGSSWLGLANVTTRDYTDTGAIGPGLEYYYRVRGRNAAGVGPWSDNVRVLVLRAPTLSLARRGPTECQLTWTAVDGAASYKLFRHHANSNTDRQVGGVLTETTYIDRGLTTDHEYYYTLQAVTPHGVAGPNSHGLLCHPGRGGDPPMYKPVLSVEGTTATTVRLRWTTVADTTVYELQRYDYDAGRWTLIDDTLTGATYTDSGLTTGKLYYYAVRGRNDAGDGEWSESVPVTPKQQLLATTTLSGQIYPPQDGPSATISLSWDAVPSATGYRLLRRVGNGALDQIGGDLPKTTTTYTDSDLTPGTSYGYVVYVKHTAGKAVLSNYVKFRIPSSLHNIPSKPELLIKFNDGKSNRLILYWARSRVSRVGSYELERRIDGGEWESLGHWDHDEKRKYEDPSRSHRDGLEAGLYEYRIRNQQSDWEGLQRYRVWGPWSNVAQARVEEADPDTPKPSEAPVMSLRSTSSTQISLAWTDVTGATSYEMRRCVDEWIEKFVVETVIIDGVLHGVGLFFTGGTASLVIVALKRVSFIGGLSGAISPLHRWCVDKWEDVGVIMTETTYTDRNVSPGLYFYYQVRGRNNAGPGPWSNVIQTQAGTPTLYLRDLTENSIELMWTGVGGATGYEIDNCGPLKQSIYCHSVGEHKPNASRAYYTKTIGNLTRGQTHRFRIRSQSDAGRPSDWSNVITVKPGQPFLPPSEVKGEMSYTDRGALEVRLSWDEVKYAAGYEVRRHLSSWARQHFGIVPGREYTDKPFPRSATYHYSVRAINSFGGGPWVYMTCNTKSGKCE